ncbi:MAG: DUF4249 family protein [Longimonas sp.]|uniref:DUF4249 family protein n=1 Tax=Longimonas sp. TaxID=2039626 RepID=UPI00336177FB
MHTAPLHWLAIACICLSLGIGLGGCDTVATDPESEVVVEAYLIAEEPLPPVRLMQSVAATDRFDPEEAAVRGANVVIQQLASDGTATATYPYEETTPGLYRSVDDPPPVIPRARYRLDVTTTDDQQVRAETTVPDTIEVIRIENTDVVYQGPEQPQFTIRPTQATERQNVYAFSITSLLDFDQRSDDELAQELTPFYADVYDPDEDNIAEFRRGASPLINERTFTRNDDGTITLDVPWIGFAFYGQNDVAINAPDENYYDLVRTQDAQQGGLSPGEIPNVIDRIEGGTGIFGSLSRTSATITVERPPEL